MHNKMIEPSNGMFCEMIEGDSQEFG